MPLKLRSVLCFLVFIEFAFAKIYDRCELAKELKYIHEFPQTELSTWICIAQHESLLNTSAMNPGSGDHGLFQISQVYWCSPPGYGCNTACVNFRDDNIVDDVKCVRKIFKEHQKLFGNGFQAWAVYPLYCHRDTQKYIDGCFENEIDNSIPFIEEEKPIAPPEDEDDDGYDFPPLPTRPKIYNRCELADELKYVHQIPQDQISKWICIVEHESNYNTSAANKGSGDHGLFQISEQYWCSRNSVGYGCNANCAAFRDNYIADDVKCVRRIYDEHTAISGDGFNAWAVYPLYCKGDTSRYIRGCSKNEKTTERTEEYHKYEFPSFSTTHKNVEDNSITNNENGEYEFPALPIITKNFNKESDANVMLKPFTTEKDLFSKQKHRYSSISIVPETTTKSFSNGRSTLDIFSKYFTSTTEPVFSEVQRKLLNILTKNSSSSSLIRMNNSNVMEKETTSKPFPQFSINKYAKEQLRDTTVTFNLNISGSKRNTKQRRPGPHPPPPPPLRPARPSRPGRPPSARPSPPPLPPQGFPRPIVTFTPLYTEIPPSTSAYITTPKYKGSKTKNISFSSRGALAVDDNFSSSSKSFSFFTTSKPRSSSLLEIRKPLVENVLKFTKELKSDFSSTLSKQVNQNVPLKTTTNVIPVNSFKYENAHEEFPGYRFQRTAFGFRLFQRN